MQRLKPWVSLVARIGFVGKGTVYVMLGLAAVALAIGVTSEVEDLAGTIEVVSRKSYGALALLLLAFGLANYALWNAVQAVWDPERVGGNWIGNALRVIFALSAAMNSFLAYKTAGVAFGHGWGGGASGDDAVQSWTQRALAMPGGRVLVLMAAAVMAGIATSLVVRLVRGKYMNLLTPHDRAGAGGSWVKACAWYDHRGTETQSFLTADYVDHTDVDPTCQKPGLWFSIRGIRVMCLSFARRAPTPSTPSLSLWGHVWRMAISALPRSVRG